MYRALLWAQWRSTAPVLFLFTMLAFAMPLGQVLFTQVAGSTGSPEDAGMILRLLSESSPVYPFMALYCGGLAASFCWTDDQRGKHVYALSLPVPRWYYLLLRMGVGMTYLAAPVVAVWISALIAVSQVALPQGLHAYPGGIAVRFGLASAVVFAAVFSLGTLSKRNWITVAWVAGAGIALLLLFAMLGLESPIVRMGRWLMNWPSFIDTFTGRWLLVDV